jgi:hypothetical protein
MRKSTALLVLIVFVLGVYYPTIFAGVNSLDDFRMLEELPKSGALNILSLFNPSHSAGYFRPLTILSYYIDVSLLNLTPEAMHLENVLIHLANSMLVLLVGLSVFRGQERQVELSFVAACVFALHPLNVEAVAWISGRTDPLTTFFALLSLITLYRFVESKRLYWLWLCALLCVVGALAKETALFCLPAAFMLACANDVCLRSAFRQREFTALFARASLMVAPFLLTSAAYLAVRLTTLRYVAKTVAAKGVAGAEGNVVHTLFTLVRDLFTTYGFYTKKLFLPLPLNFAITEIHGTYLWLGLVVLVFTIYCLVRRLDSIAFQMLLATLTVMFSSFVISRAGIAWTPYAERYLYLPTVFFAFGIVDAGRRFCLRFLNRRAGVIAAFILLGLMTTITASRSMIWQNNLSLYQDTIRKSPNFGCISNELAIALFSEKRLDEAMAQIERGKQAKTQGDMVLLYVNQASILGEKKQYADAYRALACTYRNGDISSAHIEVIKSYINLMERERIEAKDSKRADKLLSKLADLHELYYRRSGDTDHLYRTAQLTLAAGNRSKAHVLFCEVADRAPKESMYKEFALKMSKKTEKSSR